MKIILICLALLLSGCLVGPNYYPPPQDLPDCWHGESDPLVSLQVPAPADWWSVFDNPLLSSYMVMTASHNLDVNAAEVAICQARAIRKVTASALYPHLNLDISALRTYFSKNGLLSSFMAGQQTASPTGAPFTTPFLQVLTLYNVLIDATWQVDLFGKTRRAVEAADAQIGSAIAQRDDLLISMLAEVGHNYIQLRSSQQQGVLIEEYLSLLNATAEIIRKRVEVGYTNQLDLERIEAEIATTAATLPPIIAQIYQSIYALSVLTGALPETLLCELLPIQPLPTIPDCIGIGIRSDLLRRRPDIRQAERELAAATANIGVAVASFFPSLNLVGGAGLQSRKLSNLFSSRSRTYAIAGDLHVPLYTGGKLTGNLRIAEAQAATAYLAYQQTVLRAVEEAESSLIAFTEEIKQTQLYQDSEDRYAALVFLTNMRFTTGLVSLTDLLDIERQLNTSQQNTLTSTTQALQDLVLLFQSLGGGWELYPP